MSDLITITRAKPFHIDVIQHLISLDPEHLLPRSNEEIASQLSDFFVALDAEKVIGCVCFEQYNHKIGELRSLYVDSTYRGRGIGTLLIQTVVEYAKTRGVSEILTITSAIDLFEKNGFGYSLPSEKQALFYSFRS